VLRSAWSNQSSIEGHAQKARPLSHLVEVTLRALGMRMAWALLAPCIIAGCGISKVDISREELSQEVSRQQPQFQPIVTALEQYHGSQGRYPDSLKDLNQPIPPVTTPKVRSTLAPWALHYEVARDRSFFRLAYGVEDKNDSELHAFGIYTSLKREWDFSGSPSPFTVLEARRYGERSRETGSHIDLDLAVQSLLDSVRKTNGPPCRNFWKPYVDNSIGMGQSTSRSFLDAPAYEGVRIFTSGDKKRTYAFLFRKQIYPPMTTALPIVVAIYRGNGGRDAEVTLQQVCDSSA
jgi:hypothetical protein